MAAGVLAWCTQAMASVGVTIPNDLLLKLQSMGLVYFFCLFRYCISNTAFSRTGRAPQIVASDGRYIRS